MTYGFSKKCRFWRGVLLAFSVAAFTAFSASAVTIHRSFQTREAGFGFGTGTAGVAYPVGARIDKAIDEARQKEAEQMYVSKGWHSVSDILASHRMHPTAADLMIGGRSI